VVTVQEEATFRNNIFELQKATGSGDWNSTDASGGGINTIDNSLNFLIKSCLFKKCTANKSKGAVFFLRIGTVEIIK